MSEQDQALIEQKWDYESNGVALSLTFNTVRKFLVNGSGQATDQEIVMFIALCSHQRLNPFLREAYLIKYSDKYPATIVVGKEAFTRRADAHPQCDGWEAGITKDEKGQLSGGWAKVYRKDRRFPVAIEVDFKEYVGMKGNEVNKQWSSKPATMIRKVALVQALREAFPNELGGMYAPEEMGVSIDLPSEALDMGDLSKGKLDGMKDRLDQAKEQKPEPEEYPPLEEEPPFEDEPEDKKVIMVRFWADVTAAIKPYKGVTKKAVEAWIKKEYEVESSSDLTEGDRASILSIVRDETQLRSSLEFYAKVGAAPPEQTDLGVEG